MMSDFSVIPVLWLLAADPEMAFLLFGALAKDTLVFSEERDHNIIYVEGARSIFRGVTRVLGGYKKFDSMRKKV